MKYLIPVLILLGIGMTVVNYQSLPEIMPTHWNIRGQVDGYMPKEVAAWLMPGLALLMWGLFKWLPKLDPKRDKYRLFMKEWQVMQVGLMGFFLYVHGVMLQAALKPGTDITRWMFVGLGVLFVLMGNYMGKIRQNYFIGIKVPWTLASEDNWNKTHRYASWWMVGAGLVTVMEAFVPWQAPMMVFGGIILSVAMPIIYSYLLFTKQPEKMKLVYGVVLAVGLLIAGIRMVAGEDDWICVKGEWVKHGQPTAVKPTELCD